MNQQKTFDAKNFTVISGQADEKELLGKFVYFSLGNVLAEKSAKEKSIGNLKKLKKDEGAKRVQQKDRRRNAG
ncbi:hypothetical protein D3Z48_03585, partial [Clostridiaceae bacterium]|nr:hypothetical protein [Clostridiaceae bacterium]